MADYTKAPSPALQRLVKRLHALPTEKNAQEQKIYLGLLRDIYKQAKADGNALVENQTKQVLRKYYQ